MKTSLLPLSLNYPIPPTEKLLMFPVSYMSLPVYSNNYTYVCISVSVCVYISIYLSPPSLFSSLPFTQMVAFHTSYSGSIHFIT